jgi:DNA-binding NtrC family response regulator
LACRKNLLYASEWDTMLKMLSLRIIVVDDEKNQREMLSGFLQRKGYSVTTADSAESALEILHRKAFEIGLFDMKMSGQSGLDLLKKAKDRDPEMQVVVITAFGTVDTAVEAMRAGAYDYLSKPINLDELLELIRRAGERHYLLSENRVLRERLQELEVQEIVGVSTKLKQTLSEISRVAPTDTTVLITGESGTGKELVARTIHRLSTRNSGRFVAVNCAAIPETLLESELLGHEKGAFTGADRRRIGKFELASGGTIFMDEIGDLPAAIQVKLLRIIEEKRFERLGGEEEVFADCRIIAATNRNLTTEVEQGRFREDLFYRINVVNIHLPPLRERREDVMPLVDYFLRQTSARLNRPTKGISVSAKDLLLTHEWPGNVRELANALERAIVLSRSDILDVDDFPQIRSHGHGAAGELVGAPTTLREMEKQHIERILTSTNNSLQQAADLLGIHRNTLRQKMKEYEINRPSE